MLQRIYIYICPRNKPRACSCKSWIIHKTHAHCRRFALRKRLPSTKKRKKPYYLAHGAAERARVPRICAHSLFPPCTYISLFLSFLARIAPYAQPARSPFPLSRLVLAKWKYLLHVARAKRRVYVLRYNTVYTYTCVCVCVRRVFSVRCGHSRSPRAALGYISCSPLRSGGSFVY